RTPHRVSGLPVEAARCARDGVRVAVGSPVPPGAGWLPQTTARRPGMPTYLSPGVCVEEVDSGARPLEGVGTAVAAFVGLAEKGPFNVPTLVSSWTAFSDAFGGFVPGSYLARSVYGYFMNGGGNCYVVRIGEDGAPDNDRKPKQLTSGP